MKITPIFGCIGALCYCLFSARIETLVDRFRLLIDSKDLRESMGEEARRTALNYNWRIEAERISSALKSVMKRTGTECQALVGFPKPTKEKHLSQALSQS